YEAPELFVGEEHFSVVEALQMRPFPRIARLGPAHEVLRNIGGLAEGSRILLREASEASLRRVWSMGIDRVDVAEDRFPRGFARGEPLGEVRAYLLGAQLAAVELVGEEKGPKPRGRPECAARQKGLRDPDRVVPPCRETAGER